MFCFTFSWGTGLNNLGHWELVWLEEEHSWGVRLGEIPNYLGYIICFISF